MASISIRTKNDGSKSYMVRWRDPKTRANQGLTVATEAEAETLKRLLDDVLRRVPALEGLQTPIPGDIAGDRHPSESSHR